NVGKYQMPPNERQIQFSALVAMGMQGERWESDVRAQTSITPFERFTRIQNVVYALTLGYRLGPGSQTDTDTDPHCPSARGAAFRGRGTAHRFVRTLLHGFTCHVMVAVARWFPFTSCTCTVLAWSTVS